MESIGYLSNNLFDINCTGYFETSWGPFIRSDNSSCATWGGQEATPGEFRDCEHSSSLWEEIM